MDLVHITSMYYSCRFVGFAKIGLICSKLVSDTNPQTESLENIKGSCSTI
jgi:hypothetical protein